MPIEMEHAQVHKAVHKDKLAETKKQEALIHEALKQQAREEKEARQQAHKEEKEAYKAVRACNLSDTSLEHHSKRAIKEQREAAKAAAKAATATVCEHGIVRCKICFPVRSESDKYHDHLHERRSLDGDIKDSEAAMD